MEVSTESNSWSDELASLVEDTGIIFPGDSMAVHAPELSVKPAAAAVEEEEAESLKDQIKGFAAAWGELAVELGRGFRDVVQQTILTEDSYIVKKTKEPLAEVSEKLRFLNEFLPEDRDPVHVWPVILFVSIIALAVLNVSSKHDIAISTVKKVRLHPPSAERILLPDNRHLAYHEIGVPADKARYSMIVPHGFLSSRFTTGTLGIKVSLLEQFGVRLISYDLPGFGESDPHPDRNLNSSALDLSHLANSVGVKGKFWVLGYSSGSLHAWAALKYIPNKVAGAVMLAPLVNPYDSSMTKEEMTKTWENWTRRRRLLFYLARRFPKFLGHFYHQTFLSGKHGQIQKWLSLSLGRKDKDLVEASAFEEIWHRDVEESVYQGNLKPFVEEARLQVSDWGFSLVDLQVQRKCPRKSIFPWLQFMYGPPECQLTGYLGPIHIWQGMDDMVVPPSMTDFVARILPTATMHRLPEEGHFSYFSLCDECHRNIFSTIFGSPQGPLSNVDNTLTEDKVEDASAQALSATI
ncbi:alpha/beta-Hydrolases superfamily protein [Perilla frutescens var. hirtella]|uniref:Alpha/beta-Hydrolases superfamily protein n=1 Tax=Perilla frutescens var. hirtella TaxID=608512 RepID=A0AAD4P496_PERFH|nr:alpha/beta-Hydrolases superfamily protein [Perilla frutescens var. hirtella]